MAKKGDVARERVKDIITNAFGENFVCVQDKKIYVMAADESGEKIQFAISITMPKTPIGVTVNKINPNDWTEKTNQEIISAAPTTSVTMSAEDEAKVAELMKTLGIVD